MRSKWWSVQGRSPLPPGDIRSVRGLRVLLISEDEQLRNLLTGALGYHGAAVCAVGSAQEALRAVDQFKPHILISDCPVPTAEGAALLQRLRALELETGSRIPTVALTEPAISPTLTPTIAGFQVAIQKSLDPQSLLSTIARLAAVSPPA